MTTASTPTRTDLRDASARASAVAERARNVVIDAGAGTGKTTLLVERMLELVAPRSDGPAIALERVAGISFTRRAAGELRLRLRARLIAELSTRSSAMRRDRLRRALSVIDVAFVGTIHSFADRLLRMRPSSSRLGAAYEVVDQRDALVAETTRALVLGAPSGEIAARLEGKVSPDLLHEAPATILDALAAGLRPVSFVTEFWTYHGLDALVRGFVEHRDVDPSTPEIATPDRARLAAALQELAELGAGARGESTAATWFRRIANLARNSDPSDDNGLFAGVAAEIRRRRRSSNAFKRGEHCDGDAEIWSAWKRLDRDGAAGPALGDAIVAPLHAWMATRLLRLRPVVLALYEDVKQRHGVLDELDLLLRLRDTLRDDLEARAFYKAKFDHLFVDEFQDTDPLQAEVLLCLAEGPTRNDAIDRITPAPGRVTIVGDPQQSIYRFRRADVTTFARFCDRLGPDALRLELDSNFRSVASLVDWGNQRFREVFGVDPSDVRVDGARGRVRHRDLVAARSAPTADRASVHVVPVTSGDKLDADAWRDLEARALPRYLQWLVHSGMQVSDDGSGGRPIAWGDICILAASTIHLHGLFAQLDTLGIPYTAGGGTLFLDDPLQRLFVLALRAIADRTDGPAAAALRRPPFFAVDLAQLVAAHGCTDLGGEIAAMETCILELRRARLRRTPGATARALLEQTCLGAAISVGPNGAQRLGALRELCHLADLMALETGLDYDGVTARMRGWLDRPETIDAPAPIRPRAVRVMTIHQAKGLEFPVVVLWDGRAQADTPAYPRAWQVSRDGRCWTMTLDGLHVSEPAGQDLAAVERSFFAEERRRLSYVAVTRARDLLVVPHVGPPGAKLLWRSLSEAEHGAVHVTQAYDAERGAPWAEAVGPIASLSIVDDGSIESSMAAVWRRALATAQAHAVRTIAVTTAAHEAGASSSKPGSRHGPRFGTAVHRALGVLLQGSADLEATVVDCCRRHGLELELHAHVESDLRRTLARLRALGFARETLRVEYPVAGRDPSGALLIGAIDLLAMRDDTVWVIDFKTDVPPRSEAAREYPAYAAQVRLYADMLARAGIRGRRPTRCALLFTGDGSLHEIVDDAQQRESHERV